MSDAPNATVGAVTMEPIDLGRYGDDSAAFHVEIPVTNQGESLQFVVDLVLVRSGLVERTYSFTGDRPLDPAVERALLAKAEERVTAV